MTQTYFTGSRQGVQEDLADSAQHRRQMARTVNLVLGGQDNSTFTVTLTPNAATTVIYDSRISIQTALTLMPTTANAAAAIPTTYAVCANGTATIYHANNAQVDRTYILGMQG